MAPKSKPNASGQTLRQGTLSFASAKRGSTAVGKANTLKASPSVTSAKPPGSETRAHGSRTASLDSTISINTSTTNSNSDDDVVLVTSEAAQRAMKRRRTETGPAKAAVLSEMRTRKIVKDSDSSSEEEPEEPQELDAVEKKPQIQKLYNQTRYRMGEVPPVHAEKQRKAHHILRVFDTSYEYGPCVGMTRLERWDRAHALRLNPPFEVREILTTKQGLGDDTLKECVFYDDV